MKHNQANYSMVSWIELLAGSTEQSEIKELHDILHTVASSVRELAMHEVGCRTLIIIIEKVLNTVHSREKVMHIIRQLLDDADVLKGYIMDEFANHVIIKVIEHHHTIEPQLLKVLLEWDFQYVVEHSYANYVLRNVICSSVYESHLHNWLQCYKDMAQLPWRKKKLSDHEERLKKRRQTIGEHLKKQLTCRGEHDEAEEIAFAIANTTMNG